MKRYVVSALTVFFACALSRGVSAQAHFLRGDSNHDQKIDISDGVNTLGYLFLGTGSIPCKDAGDANDSGALDIADAIFTLNFLFQGGPPPAAPYPIFEADPTPDTLDCLGPPVDVIGDITTDTNWTNDKVYNLAGGVFVKDGATLSIEEGTTILGKKGAATDAGLLVVERGGKLIAVGTATHPIVFTSEAPVGSRKKSDWGGIIMLGRGAINVSGGQGLAEGLENKPYGGGASPDNTDSSGRLSYVRVEYGGVALSLDNEVNGISLFGCGSGTQLDHIQVKYNDDDAVEWFGGAATLKFGLSTGNTDDNIDMSFGSVGKVQFFVAHQNKDDTQGTGNGFEWDNSEPPVGTFGDLPRTDARISNVTMIGTGDPAGTTGGQGMLLRRGTGAHIYNTIIQGWRVNGFDIDDAVTTNTIDTDGFVVDYMVFAQNGAGGTVHCQPAGSETTTQKEDDPANNFLYTSCSFIQTKMTHNVFSTDPQVVDGYNLTAPNFRPQNDALTNPFDPTTLDSFFEPAAYRGGVPPAPAEDWTHARWISYLRN